MRAVEILAVLSALEKLETELGDFYEWLSDRLASKHEEAAGFFFRMSTQERSHANLVRYGKRLVHQNGSSYQKVSVNLSKLDELIDSIEVFRSEHEDPTPAEALLFAMQLETDSEVDVHRSAIISANPQLADLVERLAAADHKHFETLKAFANEHSDVFNPS